MTLLLTNLLHVSFYNIYGFRYLNVFLGEIEELHTYLVEEVAAGMRCKRASVIEKRIGNAEKILIGNSKRLANYNNFL